jgi:cell shape-determining protein MreC
VTESQNTGTFRVLAACLLGAAMFAVLPASATTPVRDILRLAISPGQRMVNSAVATAESRWQKTIDQRIAEQQLQIERLQREVATTGLKERRALLAVEAASQELANVSRHGNSPFDVASAPSLIRPGAIRASVLGREILSEVKSRQILDKGSSDGISSDYWVLNGDLPVVQAGSELNVADGLPVFAGRCIVGRIVEAGRWTSSLQFLTEPGFRARAIIGRVTSDDPVAEQFSFGAEGLLEGRSDLQQAGKCELAQIPATEHVDVGMPVYSPATSSVDVPMLFGHVASAEIPRGALHWTITVQPAADLAALRHVEIVVPELSTDFGSPSLSKHPRPTLRSADPQTPLTDALSPQVPPRRPQRGNTSATTSRNEQNKLTTEAQRRGGGTLLTNAVLSCLCDSNQKFISNRFLGRRMHHGHRGGSDS